MTGLLALLVSIALGMGLAGLLAFLWSMKSGQLEDLDGAAERVLFQGQDTPLPKQERHCANGVDDAKERPSK
jgi:cbb3-type cytochrome oxidase maturation protein